MTNRDTNEEPFMATRDETVAYRGHLSAMVLAVQSNRGAVERLAARYGMFRFTGGDIPTDVWHLEAVRSFLTSPFVTHFVTTGAVQRYQDCIKTIIALSATTPQSVRPKTLRSRHELATTFRRASADVLASGKTLESALTSLIANIPPNKRGPAPSDV